MESRIRNKDLLKNVVSPEIAATAITNGMIIGASGGMYFSGPRRVFKALAERGRRGELRDLTLWSSSLLSKEIDGLAAESGILGRRLGSIGDRTIRKQINACMIQGNDFRTENFPQCIRGKTCGKIDVAILEAVGITEEGHIIPALAVLEAPNQVAMADIVIVEVNQALPAELEGLHDIYLASQPPKQKEPWLENVGTRLGTPYIPVPEDKVLFIVQSNQPEGHPEVQPATPESQKMSEHLISFLQSEISLGKLPRDLCLSSGIGTASDAILKQLSNSAFKNIQIFTPCISDGVIELIDSGRCNMASGPVLSLSRQGWGNFVADIDKYKRRIVVRSSDLIYDSGVIRRFGCVALINALEIDIYGHVNSTHTGGTWLVNGVGGGGVFSSNAYLSVFLTLSSGRNGAVSCIVPMVPHVDHTEHNVDVIVTEQGLADLRGLSPVERAEQIIRNCAHPDYRSLLSDYLHKAIRTQGGHEPHILEEAFSFHSRLKQNGSMR